MTNLELLEKKIKSLENAIDIAIKGQSGAAVKECLNLIEFYNTIKQDLERFKIIEENYYSLNKEYEEIKFENVRLEKENVKLKQELKILEKYLDIFIDNPIPENPNVEVYYLSLKNKNWIVEIDEDEYQKLKEGKNNNDR